jgi:glutathione peroxidase
MNVHSFDARTADGTVVTLADYAGQVMLVVNVASKCGLTPQYEGLERLHRDFADKGLAIVAFPCNQFGGQEPGSDADIQQFCVAEYDVTFPVYGKIDVNGPGADPLYQYLRAADPGYMGPDTPNSEMLLGHLRKAYPEVLDNDSVRWNFTKFLVGRDGEVIRRYEPVVTPEEIRADLADALA